MPSAPSDARRRHLVAVILTAVAVAALAVLALWLSRGGEPVPAARRTPSASASPSVSPAASASPSPTAEAGPPAGIRVVSARSYGAIADDGGDDTQAIAAALGDVAGTDVAVLLPAGTYDVSTLLVPAGSRLVGEGRSRTWLRGGVEVAGGCRVSDLRAGTDGRAFRFADGASHSSLARITFVGGGSMQSEQEQGVVRFGEGGSASYITFRDCIIGTNSADGNGVSIVDLGWEGATYHHLTWRRCVFKSSPRMSFECIQRFDGSHPITTGYRAVDLIDCVFEPSGSETVSYDAAGDAGYSTVSGCTFQGSGWNNAYPWGQTVEFNRTRDMVFSGNTVYRGRGAMINHNGTPGEATGTIIRDNVFDATVDHIGVTPPREVQLIYFNNVSGARFAGNEVKGDSGGELVYISGSSGNSFSGNRFVDTRPAAAAFACLKLAAASRDNRFTGELFQTGALEGAILAQDGSSGNLVERSVFVTGGAPPATADSSSSVRLQDDAYR